MYLTTFCTNSTVSLILNFLSISTIMVKAIHEIDPNADAVLVLKKPNTNFACWNLGEVEENAIVSVEILAGEGFSTETSR
jgi:hypothetical protein